ncbi:MAG TPA: cytochrome C oxidase subunit IV family protein [Verrucomicrobiales bacterium]|nr:cytochrome C oxidase subunit IV family protein [Verrucomicrobiales bacterium]
MAETPEEIRKHIRLYWGVGITLLVFTVVTVVVAKVTPSITIGLLIATFKAGLVALIFMHLNSEKPMIYKIMFFTAIFAAGLVWLFIWSLKDPIVR